MLGIFRNFASTRQITYPQEIIIMGDIDIYVSRVGGSDSGITWFCCADSHLALFEKQYPLADGMSYDSYVIEDEKLAVVDTVDHAVEGQWRDALSAFLADRGGCVPDYLIVQHLEPDHSAAIEAFMADYPGCSLVCSAKASGMIARFASGIDAERIVAVNEGDTLDLGSRQLRFMMAPMVHWPEVMVTYDGKTGTVFSADAFGTFGVSLASEIARGVKDCRALESEWEDEARRYYINICGKYGGPVQALLKKVAGLDINWICPLHGPVIDPKGYNPVGLYDIWSRYEPQYPGKCLVVAASLHGFTVEAARDLADMLVVEGVEAEAVDLAEADISEVVSRAFACGATVFMSSTYDASLVPSMRNLLGCLKSKGWQKRIAGVVENGSWAPIAAKLIAKELGEMKDITIVGPEVTIWTRLTLESEALMKELAVNIAEAIKRK